MTRLLTTTALLALLVGSAHADNLHKEMLGGWCATGQAFSDGDTWSNTTYVRSSRRACAGDWLQLRARGYVEQVGEPVICRFVTIKQIDRSTFAVMARCQAEESPWYREQMEFSMAGGVLTGSVKTRD
jgi:hypothetical protein